MAFIPSPTHLSVPVQVVDGSLRFLGTTTMLTRYLKHTRPLGKQESASYQKSFESKNRATSHCEPTAVPVLTSVKAWRADGKTELDAELFYLRDVGPAAPIVAGRAEVRAAQLTFRGDQYSALFGDAEKRLCDSKAQALFEAFLDHETIQLQVRIGERETASLVLKLGLIYLGDQR